MNTVVAFCALLPLRGRAVPTLVVGDITIDPGATASLLVGLESHPPETTRIQGDPSKVSAFLSESGGGAAGWTGPATKPGHHARGPGDALHCQAHIDHESAAIADLGLTDSCAVVRAVGPMSCQAAR